MKMSKTINPKHEYNKSKLSTKARKLRRLYECINVQTDICEELGQLAVSPFSRGRYHHSIEALTQSRRKATITKIKKNHAFLLNARIYSTVTATTIG